MTKAQKKAHKEGNKLRRKAILERLHNAPKEEKPYYNILGGWQGSKN